MGNNLTPRSARARRLTFCLVAVLSLLTLPLMAGSVPTAKPEDVGFSSERLPRIHEAVQRHIDAGDITGAVTLVARRGRIAHFEAHGLMDLESKRPMTKDAIFRIMSMTKPVTAVAVMQDNVAAGWRIPNGSFGWFGAYGTQVWINPTDKLVTLVMIQNLNYEVQRDFENAVVQAIVN